MDGLLPSTRHRVPLRPLAALAALLVAAALAGAAPAPAQADGDPAARWPIGGSTLASAMDLAATHWGLRPCGGSVRLSWVALGAGINAQSSWANDVDPYLQPSRNTDCEIALSTRPDWDWAMLCSVVVHEVGHLTGHDHVDDVEDVMYYAYLAPVRECALTPEPVETGAPAAAPTAPAATTAAPRGAARTSATPKPAPRTTARRTAAAKRRAAATRRKKAAGRRHH
jgi:matrixin